MKRRCRFILGLSALAGTLSFAPCVVAQTNAPAPIHSGAPLKDEANDTALTRKVQAALARDQDVGRSRRHPRADQWRGGDADRGRGCAGYR